VDLGAALGQRLGQHVRHVTVGPYRQHAVVHRLEQRRLHPEIGVHRGELGADHPATDHRCPLRELVGGAVGGVVGGEDPLAVDVHAGDRARHGTGAQDGRSALERLPVHRDGAVGGERAFAHDHLHLAALEQAGEPAVQLLDDAGLAGVRRRPVQFGNDAVGQFHPVRASVVHGAEDLGGVQQGLGRDAARCRQVPPTFSFSTRATVRPADAA